MRRGAGTTIAFALALLLVACDQQEVFVCQQQSQCVLGGTAGRCEPVGYCSFPDSACADGFRYGEHAPADFAGACVGAGGITTLVVQAAADAWINSGSIGRAYGLSPVLHCDGDPPQNAILRFDVAAVPGTATVIVVDLRVWTTAGAGVGEGATDVYRLTEDWLEGTDDDRPGTPNWTQRSPSLTWTAPGAGPGSRADAPLGSFAPIAADREYRVPLDALAVTGWVRDGGSNHGVVLVNRNAQDIGVQLHAREAADATRRPTLVLTFR